MSIPYPEYKEDVSFCRKIHKEYGKSFYLGTLLLSRLEQDATCILYAFFRYPDEYVDTYFADQKEVALLKLKRWGDLWNACHNKKAFNAEEDETRILRATAYVFHAYRIPFEYSEAFLSAMIQDTWKERYGTYAELEAYMYGSASVVGLMMTHVMCATDVRFANDTLYRTEVLAKAQALGEAFQLTNFLRDVGEDVTVRGRIYLPLEDMHRFGVTEDDIANKKVSDSFVALMKYEIKKARALYEVADKGVAMLPSRARKGIRIARVLYSKILDSIEAKKYDIYTSRIHLSAFKKLRIALPLIIKNNNQFIK